MSEIVNVYREDMPAVRLCGLSYRDEDRKNGTFAHIWKEWFEKDVFIQITEIGPVLPAFVGCMRINSLNEQEYWIGMFLKEGTTVPNYFEYIDIPASPIATFWIKGKDSPELYSHHADCMKELEKNGWEIGSGWFFERYSPERFCKPDENGEIILDYCICLDK